MFTFGLPGAKNGVVSIGKWFKLLGGGRGGGGGGVLPRSEPCFKVLEK